MTQRLADGSAGDADYSRIGPGYALIRQPDPRIAARILDALGDARTVLNVGAGAGSYEPVDREVLGRIGENHVPLRAVHHRGPVLRVQDVAAEQAVLAQQPHVARRSNGGTCDQIGGLVVLIRSIAH